MLKAILELIAKVLDLLKLSKQQQVVAEQKQAGEVQAQATAQEQVLTDVKVAQDVRAGVQRDLAADPGGLFSDDGFETK